MNNIIATNNLCGGYGKNIVINELSFEIEKGEFFGIIGPNGSGKSTLLKLLSKAIVPQKGSIEFNGIDIKKWGLRRLCQNIAFVPQETLFHFSFTVWEVVLMGRTPHLNRLQFETKKDIAIADNTLALTDTRQLKDKKIDQLSAGEAQRVIIAKALAQEPVLLLLDEPTSHLDIHHQIKILDLLKKLNRNQSLTMAMVVHDLNLASEYCDRLLLLNQGRIFKIGPPDEVLTYQNIERVYKTIVVVNENPISKKPHIVLVSEQNIGQ